MADSASAVYVEAIAVARECFGDSSIYVSHPVFGFADLCFETGRNDDARSAALEGTPAETIADGYHL